MCNAKPRLQKLMVMAGLLWLAAAADALCEASGSTAHPPAKVALQPDVLQPADPGHIRLLGFLGHRIDGNCRNRLVEHITLSEFRLLEGFRNRPGRQSYTGEHAGKWLDAAALAVACKPVDAELTLKFERVARGLMECQLPDGYLGTYLPDQRWKALYDVWVHKYNMIGLLSYYRATGDVRALESCRGMADLLIAVAGDDSLNIIRPASDSMTSSSVLEPICCLYQYTGEPRYRTFAEYIIRKADEDVHLLTNIEQFKTVQKVGNRKAYQMINNFTGLLEYYRGTGNQRALDVNKIAWQSIRDENRYLTGGLDAHETFCPAHRLCSDGRCTENCVQVSWLQMNLQLLRITGEACYADEIHRLVYNHLTAAQRPDGSEWCYFTTIEGEKSYEGTMTCCSSSGARAIALLPTAACMTGTDRLAVNLYETGTFHGTIKGVPVTLRQETGYPSDGRIHLWLSAERPVEFQLQLLVPFFFTDGELRVRAEKGWVQTGVELSAGTYASLQRRWQGTTELELDLAMPVTAVHHRGRVALRRGPQVLALEDVLNPALKGKRMVPETDDVQLAKSEWQPADETLGGCPGGMVLTVAGRQQAPEAGGEEQAGSGSVELRYRPFSEAGSAGGRYSIYLPRLAKLRLPRPSKEGGKFGVRIPGLRSEVSRHGTIRGSFTDGDERTTYFTNTGEKYETDMFVALYAKPLKIDNVIFIHGRFLPGGGWWVTRPDDSGKISKPVVEVLKTPEGPWVKVAEIADYPDSTPSDPGGVKPHSMFRVPVKPVTVFGVRVSGIPACGNDPTQNLVACSELDVGFNNAPVGDPGTESD